MPFVEEFKEGFTAPIRVVDSGVRGIRDGLKVISKYDPTGLVEGVEEGLGKLSDFLGYGMISEPRGVVDAEGRQMNIQGVRGETMEEKQARLTRRGATRERRADIMERRMAGGMEPQAQRRERRKAQIQAQAEARGLRSASELRDELGVERAMQRSMNVERSRARRRGQ
jgi:hypothetical protein